MDTSLDRRAFERRLYRAAALLFALIVVSGFARTYYLKALFAAPPLTALVHLHGLLMTAWVAVFATQVWLISTTRVRVHQRLGYASIALAAAVFFVGVRTALHAARLVLRPGETYTQTTIHRFSVVN